MPSIVARTTVCVALLATPMLALAQGSILPQQRDAAGNVMEPLGQVLMPMRRGRWGSFEIKVFQELIRV